MNTKVARLVALVDEGYTVEGIDPRFDGGLRLSLSHGDEAETFDFEFFEVPAIHCATRVVGCAQ